MNTILFWEMIPEQSDLYVIPDAPGWLEKCHGNYINHIDVPDEITNLLLRVSDALSSKIEYCSNKKDPLATKWAKYKKKESFVINGPCRVVKCGFLV